MVSIEEIAQGAIVILLIAVIAYLYIVSSGSTTQGRFRDLDLLVGVFLAFATFVWLIGFGLWAILGTAIVWVVLRLLVVYW